MAVEIKRKYNSWVDEIIEIREDGLILRVFLIEVVLIYLEAKPQGSSDLLFGVQLNDLTLHIQDVFDDFQTFFKFAHELEVEAFFCEIVDLSLF